MCDSMHHHLELLERTKNMGFTGGAIPYHVGLYWGLYIEEK